ncbi:MAG: L-serine ammonia-lyase, iron-sulfur-dependent subunit beta [Candidatus Hermodarchaeota archaeon]
MGKADSVFEVIGPIMIGPSSSHTAAAVRIGQISLAIMGEPVVEAIIQLHGSYALTGKGHGTDKAIIAGLLGYDAADERIKESFVIAKERGMKVKFQKVDLGEDYHPNTLRLLLAGESGTHFEITAVSVGGGNISIIEINGLPIQLSGEYHTLITIHNDRPGIVAKASALIAQSKVNISTMHVSRQRRGGLAAMAVEMDQPLPSTVINELEDQAQIVRIIPPIY